MYETQDTMRYPAREASVSADLTKVTIHRFGKNAILASRILTEIYRPLYVTYVDLKSAFD